MASYPLLKEGISMELINSLRVINIFSLIFIVLNYIFNNIEYSGVNFTYFIVISALNIFSFKMMKVKKTFKLLPMVNLLMIIFANSNTQGIFIVIITGLSIYCLYKDIYKVEYNMFLIEFRNIIRVIIGTALFALLTFSIKIFEEVSVIYILVYLISSVFLLRSLRYIKYHCYDKKARKSSIIVLSISLIISTAFSMEFVRDTILGILKKGYLSIVDKLAEFILWIFYPIIYGIEKLVLFLQGKMAKVNQSKQIVDANDLKLRTKNITGKSIIEIVLGSKIFMTIINIVIVLAALYILFRVIKKVGEKSREREYYIEEREFIIEDGKSNVLKRLSQIIKPKNNVDKMRQNYIRFLKLCREKGIIIQNSHTTMDINKNAESIFDRSVLSYIRNVYIDARYGNRNLDDKTLKQFIKSINDIKK